MAESFSENGFLIIKNAIRNKTIQEIHLEIFNFLNKSHSKKINQKKLYDIFFQKTSNLKTSEYDFTEPLFNILFHKKLLDKILLENLFYKTLSNLMGRDLAYCYDPSINLNLPNKDSSKKNYLFKDWHQEIWSGANPSTAQIWTPILQKDRNNGQIELIVGSHKWGHIPHRNRKPIDLPKNFKTLKLTFNYGDVIIFSTLLLHRSLPTRYPRLALPLLLRNFKNKDDSFQQNRNWKIFSYSEFTKIEKILGNHYLSPYRIMIDNKFK